MSTVRVDNIENIEGSVDIDVRDIQVSYDALVNKGEYREGIILKKYQDAFTKEGVWYVSKRRKLPFSLTGDWEIDKEKVRIHSTLSHEGLLNRNSPNAHDASAIGFKQAGSEAVKRSADDKLKESVSVRDYGVLGDGSDETSLIQNAIDQAALLGKELIFDPSSQYLFSQIVLKSNSVIRTGGAIFRTTGDMPSVDSIAVEIQDDVCIDEFNFSHPGGSPSGVYYVMRIHSNVYINKLTVIADTQTNNSCVHLIGSEVEIGRFKSRNFDRPLYISGLNGTTHGVRVLDVEIENYIRGIKVANSKNYVIGNHRIYGRSSNIDPAIITAGHNGMLFEGAPDGLVGDGYVMDAGEHGYRIGGSSLIQTRNVKFGSLLVVRPRGGAFKINPSGVEVTGGFVDRALDVHVDSLVGIDCGDGQLGALGKQPDFLRITSTDRFTAGDIFCYNVDYEHACAAGIALNDCTSINIGSANIKNAAGELFRIRESQDIVSGNEGPVNGVYIGTLIGTVGDGVTRQVFSFSTKQPCGDIHIMNASVSGNTINRLVYFDPAFVASGYIYLFGSSRGSFNPISENRPQEDFCILNWTHNERSYTGAFRGYRTGLGVSQLSAEEGLSLSGEPNGLYINNNRLEAEVGSYTAGVEFGRRGSSRRGAAIAGKHTSSNLAQMGLAFLVKPNTTSSSDELYEAAHITPNGDLRFTGNSRGPVIKSAGGASFRIVVDDDGNLSAVSA